MGSRLGRQQAARTSCSSCGEPLDPGATRCGCGSPTDEMSFEDRARYEVERWRSYRASGSP